jgi:hypothetical protein
MHRPKEALFKGRIVQGMHQPRDALSKEHSRLFVWGHFGQGGNNIALTCTIFLFSVER